MEITLQEKLITELLDPRSSASPREIAARDEILWLRSLVSGNYESWNAIPQKKAETNAKGKREVDNG